MHNNSNSGSLNKPPYFDGSDYTYWKNHMRIFMESVDPTLWHIIENGPLEITKVVNETTVKKPFDEWDENDKKKSALNSKAINCIYCAVNADEFRKLSRCDTAKQMWDKLKITYEGTSELRKSKIDVLMKEYENFQMKETEKIDEMFERFGRIINDLDSLGRRLEQEDMVRKVMRSLSSIWAMKVTALHESQKLEDMTIDDLRGNLLTYESTFLSKEVENLKNKSVALKAEESDDDDEDFLDEEDMALLTKRFKKFLRKKPFVKKNQFTRNQSFRKDNSARKDISTRKDKDVTCYECKKPGHVRPDCPLLKKSKFRKKKAMVAETTWDDEEDLFAEEDDDDSEEAETANLCLMAATDDNEVNSELNIFDGLNIDEIMAESMKVLNNYFMLREKFKQERKEKREIEEKNKRFEEEVEKLREECDVLRKQKSELEEKNKSLEEEKKNQCEKEKDDEIKSQKKDESTDKLSAENRSLRNQNTVLKRDLENFVGSKKKLDIMLGSQKCFNDKTGIGHDGFDDDTKGKKVVKPFVKEGTLCDDSCAASCSKQTAPARKKKEYRPFINKICYRCRKKGHLANDCGTQEVRSKIRNPFLVVKQVWVLKGSMKATNNDRTQGKLGT